MHPSRFIVIVLCLILWINVMSLAISEAPISKTEANAEEHINYSMPYREAAAEPHLAVSPYSGMVSLISVYWYIKYRKEIRGFS